MELFCVGVGAGFSGVGGFSLQKDLKTGKADRSNVGGENPKKGINFVFQGLRICSHRYRGGMRQTS